MLQKITRLFGKKKQQVQMDMVFNPVGDGYLQLIAKMNAYKAQNPSFALQYSAELTYIASDVKKLPSKNQLLYCVLPYPFVLKYDSSKVEVLRDEEACMFYVYLEGKKLYYHKGFDTVESVQQSYTHIAAEQDPASPHRYLSKDFIMHDGEMVIDLGAAEGNFSLMVVEKVRQLVIVEADERWLEALEKTFEPWKNKVVIIKKFVQESDGDGSVSLQTLCIEYNPDFIKMDIEGAEYKVLSAARDILKSKKMKLAIAAYHLHEDSLRLPVLMQDLDYHISFPTGNMLFIYDRLAPPYFRKGLVRASGG
jgi:hypothetical protein